MIAWHDHSIYRIISEYLREKHLAIPEPGETDGVALEKIYTGLVVQGICIQELLSVVEPGVLLTSSKPYLRDLGKQMMKQRQDGKTSEEAIRDYEKCLGAMILSELVAKDVGDNI